MGMQFYIGLFERGHLSNIQKDMREHTKWISERDRSGGCEC